MRSARGAILRAMSSLLLQSVLLDGARCDLRVRAGRVEALRPAGDVAPLVPLADEEVLRGGMVTPPLAEPHVHLDAALLAPWAPNHSGTLREGIANWARLRPGLTAEDLRARALRTVQMYREWGCLSLRTHVDTGNALAVETLLALRQELAGQGVLLQVVAFPQEGILRAPGRRQAWERAVEAGCDAVGAIPHFERTEEEGRQSVRLAFDLAERLDRQVDLHCDETDDPASRHLEQVCALALDRGYGARVVAGHCTSLHGQPNAYAAKVCALVAESAVQVVCNPLDNVVLQGRDDGYPRRRGLTRVDELWAAGAQVGFGHDSVMDPWYPLGTGNLMDAASMAVHVGHLTGREQMARAVRTLWSENHRCFGGPPPIAVGAPARMLWWAQEDPVEILRLRPQPRLVD